jgi:hypothetical protein
MTIKYGHTDIIFTERMGNLKWYDGVAKSKQGS